MILYTDSEIARKWVAAGECRTTVERTSRNGELFERIARAERWLREDDYRADVRKWNTRAWGEIPADFGRK
jgi:ribonuclease HI